MTEEENQRRLAAVRTLERLGYTHNGGEQWRPPFGKPPAWFNAPSVPSASLITPSKEPAGAVAKWIDNPHDIEQAMVEPCSGTHECRCPACRRDERRELLGVLVLVAVGLFLAWAMS